MNSLFWHRRALKNFLIALIGENDTKFQNQKLLSLVSISIVSHVCELWDNLATPLAYSNFVSIATYRYKLLTFIYYGHIFNTN